MGEIHERIRIAFDFPGWYGDNLSTFDDMMSTECDADKVVIKGVDTMPQELKDYVQKITNILDKVVEERKHYSDIYDHISPFSYVIE